MYLKEMGDFIAEDKSFQITALKAKDRIWEEFILSIHEAVFILFFH